MKTSIFIILIVCALVAANVPLDRTTRATSETEVPSATFCAPTTPCSWTVYSSTNSMEQTHVINTYCVCQEGTTCISVHDNTDTHTLDHYCG